MKLFFLALSFLLTRKTDGRLMSHEELSNSAKLTPFQKHLLQEVQRKQQREQKWMEKRAVKKLHIKKPPKEESAAAEDEETTTRSTKSNENLKITVVTFLIALVIIGCGLILFLNSSE